MVTTFTTYTTNHRCNSYRLPELIINVVVLIVFAQSGTLVEHQPESLAGLLTIVSCSLLNLEFLKVCLHFLS